MVVVLSAMVRASLLGTSLALKFREWPQLASVDIDSQRLPSERSPNIPSRPVSLVSGKEKTVAPVESGSMRWQADQNI